MQNRGTEVIDARGLSSAASAANAAICHIRDWVFWNARKRLDIDDDPFGWQLRYSRRGYVRFILSFAGMVPISLFLVLEISESDRKSEDITYQELVDERNSVKHLLGEA